MKKTAKRAACVAAAICVAAALVTFSSCMRGPAGPSGPKGDDLDFYDVYEAVNEERTANGEEPFSVGDFVKEYFGYVSEEAAEAASRQAVMNYSLLSTVTIMTVYTRSSGSIFVPDTAEVFAGSGVIVDIDRDAGDAYIVTNAHVVYESEYGYCNEMYVYLYGNDVPFEDFDPYYAENYSGVDASDIQVVGVSTAYDLAVLKVTGSDVIKNSRAVAARFSQDEEVYAGEAVYAVGSPDAEGISVTKGIISRDSEEIALELNADYTYRVIRIDAAVNGGNSGGGLFDMQGRLIGIVNAKDEREGIDNIGFALPSSYARRIVQSMIDRYEESGQAVRYVRTAYEGFKTDVNGTYAAYDGETGRTVITETVSVYQVMTNSAATGVLRSGDVIRQLSVGTSSLGRSTLASSRESSFTVPQEGYTVAEHYFTLDITREYQIEDAMFSVRGGDTVELVIERGGQTYYAYLVYGSQSDYYITYE